MRHRFKWDLLVIDFGRLLKIGWISSGIALDFCPGMEEECRKTAAKPDKRILLE
jgi:hypothetical protein